MSINNTGFAYCKFGGAEYRSLHDIQPGHAGFVQGMEAPP